jgi:excisionase family DNA binding protein
MSGGVQMLDTISDTLTLKELQSVLRIGKNTALNLVHDDIITGHWVAGKWLFLKEDVLEYIQNH